jgi:diaphanous 1
MSNCNLVVPIILPTRSLHFAEILENGIAQDAIDTLLRIEEVTREVLGDLEDCGWALQKIRAEECGRVWEEDELTSLGDGN